MAKAKNISAGVNPQNKTKAPMVDPKGAYTKVQERTLGKMKMGGKMKKKAEYGDSMSPMMGKSSMMSPMMKKGGKVKKSASSPYGVSMAPGAMKMGGKMSKKK